MIIVVIQRKNQLKSGNDPGQDQTNSQQNPEPAQFPGQQLAENLVGVLFPYEPDHVETVDSDQNLQIEAQDEQGEA